MWSLDCALRIQNQAKKEGIQKFNSKPGLWIELGLAVGFTVLLRQVFLLFNPLLFGWLLWVFLRSTQRGSSTHRSFTEQLRGGLIYAAVLILIIAPVTVYNYNQFGQFVLLNTNAGFAFFRR